ncbi:MAG: GNAT family N-acetyltransferase [Burkholderiaceae bacterium]|nr:GNAT family N-acetyltransferase [Burkholderiaceae bacterium]
MRGQSIIVRPIGEDDLSDIAQLYSDPVFIRFIPSEIWTTPEHATGWMERILARQQAGEMVQFVIESIDEAKVVGTCLLFKFDLASQTAELGYSLSPAYWGRGWMNEALQLFIQCAFDHFDLRRVDARVDPRNVRSARVLTRLGFVLEGRLRECQRTKGELVDLELFGLLKREWQPMVQATVVHNIA